MAKRPKRSLWRRPYTSFRLGEDKAPNPDLDEQRLTLYLPSGLLDWAESHAMRHRETSLQAFCARLLQEAIETERAKVQLSDAEARRGAFEGLAEISDDPEYLAEWSASIHGQPPGPTIRTNRKVEVTLTPSDEDEIEFPPIRGLPIPMGESILSNAAMCVLKHGATGADDGSAVLPCLRRGESVQPAAAQELMMALNQLEAEYKGLAGIDRRVAYALHRLAFEGQVLHTDAWPGSFDAATVDFLRYVQEAVDRVLSGEDIRYYAQEP